LMAKGMRRGRFDSFCSAFILRFWTASLNGESMRKRSPVFLSFLLVFFLLSGCSVIVIEPKEGRRASIAHAAAPVYVQAKSSYEGAMDRCKDVFEDGTGVSCSDLVKANSARYDDGEVLKPVRKKQEKKAAEPDEEQSAFAKLIKRSLMTGMRLYTWSVAE